LVIIAIFIFILPSFLHNAGCVVFLTYLFLAYRRLARDTALMRIWKFHFQTYLYMHIAGFACDIAPISIWKFYFQTFTKLLIRQTS